MLTNLFNSFSDNYIVCGRGQRKYNSIGNKTLRSKVAEHLSVYIDRSTSRSEKSKLVDKTTKEIFAMGMIFVKESKNAKDWVTLSHAEARAKVAHRFRDAARRIYSGDDKLSTPRIRQRESVIRSETEDSSSVSTSSTTPPSLINSPPRSRQDEERLQRIKSELEGLVFSFAEDEPPDPLRPEERRSVPPSMITVDERKGNISQQDFSLTSIMSNAFLDNVPQRAYRDCEQRASSGVFLEDDDDMADLIGNCGFVDFDDSPEDLSIEEIDEQIRRQGSSLFDDCSPIEISFTAV